MKIVSIFVNHTNDLIIMTFILYRGIRLRCVFRWKFQAFWTAIWFILRVIMLQDASDSHHTVALYSLSARAHIWRSLELLLIAILILLILKGFPLDNVVEAGEILVHQQDKEAIAQHNYLKPEVNDDSPNGDPIIRQ